ncbi:MAG: RNA 2',3'-cyclic phosphodiesterase [Candidatus Omnitrophica bacterium]|nr:RNA 2',3'-cyclic phosphodiesterase [Candidatus Omnitrophota bacterium]
MSSTVRTFIAIDLNKEIRDFIHQVQSELKKIDCDVKWVTPSDAHLTIKFIGNITEEQTESVIRQLKSLYFKFEKNTFHLDKTGVFPSFKQPRIIWLGMKDIDHALKDLADTVDFLLNMIGYPTNERPFQPHVTIGRVKSQKSIFQLSQKIQSTQIPSDLILKINELILFKSTLTPTGPIYEKLAQISLGPNNA